VNVLVGDADQRWGIAKGLRPARRVQDGSAASMGTCESQVTSVPGKRVGTHAFSSALELVLENAGRVLLQGRRPCRGARFGLGAEAAFDSASNR
jgi:hypothetical protein